MDEQQTNSFYHKAWNKCGKEGTKNGNNSISSKLNKKQYKSAMLPAIFRGLGKHTNKRKTLNRYDKFDTIFYKKVQKGFLKIVEKNPRKYMKIDSNLDIIKNKEIILNKIDDLIK